MVDAASGFCLLIPVSIVLLMAYNARSQSATTSAKKLPQKQRARLPQKVDRQNCARRDRLVETTLRKMTADEKDRPAALHHVSRKFDGHRHGGRTGQIMPRCDRSPRRRFINITAWFSLGIVKSLRIRRGFEQSATSESNCRC